MLRAPSSRKMVLVAVGLTSGLTIASMVMRKSVQTIAPAHTEFIDGQERTYEGALALLKPEIVSQKEFQCGDALLKMSRFGSEVRDKELLSVAVGKCKAKEVNAVFDPKKMDSHQLSDLYLKVAAMTLLVMSSYEKKDLVVSTGMTSSNAALCFWSKRLNIYLMRNSDQLRGGAMDDVDSKHCSQSPFNLRGKVFAWPDVPGKVHEYFKDRDNGKFDGVLNDLRADPAIIRGTSIFNDLSDYYLTLRSRDQFGWSPKLSDEEKSWEKQQVLFLLEASKDGRRFLTVIRGLDDDDDVKDLAEGYVAEMLEKDG